MLLAQKQTYGSAEQNKEPRNKPTHLQSSTLIKGDKICNGKKTVSSANDAEKAGQWNVN